jgi:predicted permease
MRFLYKLPLRLRSLLRGPLVEQELSEELRFHLETLIEENTTRGMTPGDARYAALRELGGVEQIKEECRDMRRVNLIENTLQDVRYGLRQLRRSPGFTAVAALTLALGIGANTAIFSVVEGVLLAPLPYEQPDRLVAIWESNPRFPHVWICYPNFRDWQRTARSFQQMAAFTWQGYDLTSPGTPAHIDGKPISAGFFTTLGVRLALGRDFTPQEDQPGGAPVVIISNRLWRNRFAGSPQVLGKFLTLNGVDYTITGVLRPGFEFEDDADAYTPFGQGDPTFLNDRADHDGILAIARLKRGVSVAQAHAEMSRIQNGLDQLYPDADRDLGTDVVPLKQQIVGDARDGFKTRGTLLLLLGAVGLVLLIACANVASLLLARSATRRREFAIRLALGANRARVVRQLITESLLLSLAGGSLGLVVAIWGVRPVLAALPGGLPRSEEIGVNTPVLLFMVGVSITVGILFGLAPALKSSNPDLEASLKEGGRGSTSAHHRAQSSLVIVQMALTLVLLVGAGLLFRTIHHLWEVNPGFDTQNVITFRAGVPRSLMKTASSTRIAYQQLIERIRSIPGVQAADFTGAVPLTGQGGTMPFWIGSQKPVSLQAAPRLLMFLTGPDYLRTMRIPLLRGRFFSVEDTIESPCVVAIDSVFTRMYFPGRDPLGQTITFGLNPVGPCRIVGVVGHVRNLLDDPGTLTQDQAYFPLSQDPDQWVPVNYPNMTIVVRTRLASAVLMPAIKRAVYGAGREQPVYNIETMQEIASQSMASQRFPMILLGVFAALALLLASVGIYGVISYSVTQQVHEIGIRMALGARRRDVRRMVVRQGATVALQGVALGLIAAFGLTRLIAHMLFGVSAHDPLTFGGVASLLVLVALVACYIPARRATQVDPMVALRYE